MDFKWSCLKVAMVESLAYLKRMLIEVENLLAENKLNECYFEYTIVEIWCESFTRPETTSVL